MRYALLLFIIIAPLSAQDADFLVQSSAVLQDPAVSAENKGVVLHALYGQKHRMSFVDQEVFLAEAEALAREGSVPGAVHALAGTLLLRQELGLEPDPVHILMVDTEIELVISPWENVERVHAD